MTSPQTSAPRGVRHGALVAYRVALAVLLLDIALQFFLAGLGAFGGSFAPHLINGIVIAPLTLVVFVLALIARVGTRDVVLAAVVLVLAAFGQSLFRGLAEFAAFWGGLHALDGVVILGITGFLHATAIRRLRAAGTGEP
jgi:hypothetical protein